MHADTHIMWIVGMMILHFVLVCFRFLPDCREEVLFPLWLPGTDRADRCFDPGTSGHYRIRKHQLCHADMYVCFFGCGDPDSFDSNRFDYRDHRTSGGFYPPLLWEG